AGGSSRSARHAGSAPTSCRGSRRSSTSSSWGVLTFREGALAGPSRPARARVSLDREALLLGVRRHGRLEGLQRPRGVGAALDERRQHLGALVVHVGEERRRGEALVPGGGSEEHVLVDLLTAEERVL